MKDLYTKIAEEEGVDRTIVKSLALSIVYSIKSPSTEDALEKEIREVVRFVKQMGDKV